MKSIETPSGAIWCHPRMYPKTSEPNVRRCNDRPLKLHPSFAETPPLIAGHSLSAWKARLHTPWSEMPHERNIKDITYHSLHLITIHYITLHQCANLHEIWTGFGINQASRKKSPSFSTWILYYSGLRLLWFILICWKTLHLRWASSVPWPPPKRSIKSKRQATQGTTYHKHTIIICIQNHTKKQPFKGLTLTLLFLQEIWHMQSIANLLLPWGSSGLGISVRAW